MHGIQLLQQHTAVRKRLFLGTITYARTHVQFLQLSSFRLTRFLLWIYSKLSRLLIKRTFVTSTKEDM